MIPETGQLRNFKRSLLANVLLMECSGCGCKQVAKLAGPRHSLVLARFICKECENSLRPRDEMQVFHVLKYQLYDSRSCDVPSV
jgi:hypothetical protein